MNIHWGLFFHNPLETGDHAFLTEGWDYADDLPGISPNELGSRQLRPKTRRLSRRILWSGRESGCLSPEGAVHSRYGEFSILAKISVISIRSILNLNDLFPGYYRHHKWRSQKLIHLTGRRYIWQI
jgi:hypothetical protein